MPLVTAVAEESYRSDSEDRVRIQVRGEQILIVVADGVGGLAGGGAAAELAVRRILEQPAFDDERGVVAFLATLDGEIFEDRDAGETTIVVAIADESGILGASVGDSGALFVTSGGHEDLTARQQRKPVLGSSVAVPIPFRRRAQAGTLVVATDGLFNYTSTDRISEQARGQDLDVVARRLLSLVRLRSGSLQDDVAIALCRWV